MKRSIVWTVVGLLMFTLAGCGGDDAKEPVKEKSKPKKKKEKQVMSAPENPRAVADNAAPNTAA